MKELLPLEQINQWLGVLGTHMEWRLQVSKPQNTSHVCMTNLEWFQENKTIFLKFMAATCIICTWIRESHYFHPNIYFMNGAWRKCLHKFPTLGWCSTWFMGGDKMLLMGSTATHRNFRITGLPPSCEHGDSIGQTKDVMVYARGKSTSKTTLRTSLVLIWFEDSPNSNQSFGKAISPTTDHEDQSMKILPFSNKHTQGYPLEMN